LLNALLSLIAGNLTTILPMKKEKDKQSVIIKEEFIKLVKEHFKT